MKKTAGQNRLKWEDNIKVDVKKTGLELRNVRIYTAKGREPMARSCEYGMIVWVL
jgi:hypothetical protein